MDKNFTPAAGQLLTSKSGEVRYFLKDRRAVQSHFFTVEVSLPMNDGTWKVSNPSASFRDTKITEMVANGRWILLPECKSCGESPVGEGCYHICPNSIHYYSRERERQDDAIYGQDDHRERYAGETLEVPYQDTDDYYFDL